MSTATDLVATKLGMISTAYTSILQDSNMWIVHLRAADRITSDISFFTDLRPCSEKWAGKTANGRMTNKDPQKNIKDLL